MAGRPKISDRTKLAAAYCELFGIQYEHAVLMHEDQVISLVEVHHHPHPREDGLKNGMTVKEVDHHSNLVPKLIAAHRKETAEVTVPAIAKNKRIAAARAEHLARIAAKSEAPAREQVLAAAQAALVKHDHKSAGEALMLLPKNRSRSLNKPERRKSSFGRGKGKGSFSR